MYINVRIGKIGPVAQHGSRRRPSEPENVGSNPTGPAKMALNCLEAEKRRYLPYVGMVKSYKGKSGWLASGGI